MFNWQTLPGTQVDAKYEALDCATTGYANGCSNISSRDGADIKVGHRTNRTDASLMHHTKQCGDWPPHPFTCKCDTMCKSSNDGVHIKLGHRRIDASLILHTKPCGGWPPHPRYRKYDTIADTHCFLSAVCCLLSSVCCLLSAVDKEKPRASQNATSRPLLLRLAS